MADYSRPSVLRKAAPVAFDGVLRSASGPAGLSRRASVVLLMADDVSGAEVVRMTGYTVVRVSRLRRRFSEVTAHQSSG